MVISLGDVVQEREQRELWLGWCGKRLRLHLVCHCLGDMLLVILFGRGFFHRHVSQVVITRFRVMDHRLSHILLSLLAQILVLFLATMVLVLRVRFFVVLFGQRSGQLVLFRLRLVSLDFLDGRLITCRLTVRPIIHRRFVFDCATPAITGLLLLLRKFLARFRTLNQAKQCLALLDGLGFLGDAKELAGGHVEHLVLQLQRVVAYQSAVYDDGAELLVADPTHPGQAVGNLQHATPAILERVAFDRIDHHKADLPLRKIKDRVIAILVQLEAHGAEKRVDDGDWLQEPVFLFCRFPFLAGEQSLVEDMVLDDLVAVVQQVVGVKTEILGHAADEGIIGGSAGLEGILAEISFHRGKRKGKRLTVVVVQVGQLLHIVQSVSVTAGEHRVDPRMPVLAVDDGVDTLLVVGEHLAKLLRLLDFGSHVALVVVGILAQITK